MHTLITADVAREIVTERLRTAETSRRADAFRADADGTTTAAPRRRTSWIRRVRIAAAH